MTTLLLRLAGPMQSWGTESHFTIRTTGREPSKSGVIGILCAALGRDRAEPVADLAALRMGVRVEREGELHVDYQTAGGSHRRGDTYGVAKADGSRGETVVSWRYYLADANFLVGLEATASGHEDLLAQLDRALAHPHWPLALGRKAFVPGMPIRLPDAPPLGPGLRADNLEAALSSYPWPTSLQQTPQRLRLVLDADITHAALPTAEIRSDVPLSFANGARRFAMRAIVTSYLDRPRTTAQQEDR